MRWSDDRQPNVTSYYIIVLLGPTASGKSSLGVQLAKKFHGVVISADSRQVYRGLDLGTGKITKQEMVGVPHYMLDVASPTGQYSVDRYVRDVQKTLKKISRGTPVFLVGGSPFYIDALTKPNSYSPVPPNSVLRRRLEKKTTDQLLAILKKKDPARLQTIDRANRRRIIRAIEVASAKHLPEALVLPKFHILKLGTKISKQRLHRNIAVRVDQRLKQGMVNEVRRLHARGLSWKRLEAFGLEYRYIALFLQKKITKAEMMTQLKSAIRNFAKRQMTWWKRDQTIQWVTASQAAPLVKKFLQT